MFTFLIWFKGILIQLDYNVADMFTFKIKGKFTNFEFKPVFDA